MSMDPYLGSLLIGVIGLSVMALGGLDHHGQGHSSHSGHGHGGGHAHGGGHGGASHGAASHGTAVAHHGHADASHGHHDGHASNSSGTLGLLLMSPRFLFAWLIGLGVMGVVLRSWMGGVLLAAVAAVGGVAFERLLVAPLWNFTLRFASRPALTLESALDSEATVVSSFDKNGSGLVSVEVDGQVVQLLGTLMPTDRERGVRVRSGDRVRVEEIDSERNRCIVSRI